MKKKSKKKQSGKKAVLRENKKGYENKDFNDRLTEAKYEKLNLSLIKLTIVLAGVTLILGIVLVLLITFTVKNVYVEGNEHYTASQIKSFVEKGRFGDNSLYLSLKYTGKSITDIPFIQKMDVNVLDRNTVKITVYEKKMAGYVEYLGTNIYFDKDGIVVESSNVKTEGIPLVSGLDFDHFVMYEPLPVTNPDVFKTVLNTTLLLEKCEIVTDRIYFADNGDMTLFFGGIRVNMGKTENMEEKVQKLSSILEIIPVGEGLLDLSTYDNGKEDFTLTID